MAQRSLHVITKVYYRSMSCFATDSPSKAPLAVLKIPHQSPSCTVWFRQITKYVTKFDTKYDANPHSTEKDTLPIAFLISWQVVPYRARGGICYPRVSTPKIWSLADSSTTCHDHINHLHHSNHCWNHIIDLHTVTSHLDRWKITTLSQRHKPNSRSQRMRDLYYSHDYMSKHN
jgi:hypothetical protein